MFKFCLLTDANENINVIGCGGWNRIEILVLEGAFEHINNKYVVPVDVKLYFNPYQITSNNAKYKPYPSF